MSAQNSAPSSTQDQAQKKKRRHLVDGKGVDLAVISLEKEYETPDAVEACVDKPAPTTAVTMDGAFSGEQSGAIVSEPVKKDAEAFGQSYPAE